jgi:hypothetical protein
MRGLGVVTVVVCLTVACGGGPTAVRTTSTASAGPTPSPPGTTPAPSAGSGLPRGTVPATGALPSTTTAAAAATTAAATPRPTAPPSACTASDVGITTTTNRARYETGTTVDISVVVRNLAPHGCICDAPGDLSVVDAGHTAVFAVHLACPPAGCPPLAPGQRSTYPIPWNQLANQGADVGGQVPPGTYQAQALFHGYPRTAAATFSIAGGPTPASSP